MQDPNEDTEWNDVLRAKGIIPEKPKEKEIEEDDIIAMMEKTIKQKSGGNILLQCSDLFPQFTGCFGKSNIGGVIPKFSERRSI